MLVPSAPFGYTRLQDNQILRIGKHDGRVMTGFGHAPKHASLYRADLRVLVSSDMVLPRISTTVSVFASEPEANPVELYLQSLAKCGDLHTRIKQLCDHHAARPAEVVDACRACFTARWMHINWRLRWEKHWSICTN